MSLEIHDDVLFTILSKLPLKSLKRFTCVCKSWAQILETPYFMSMFRANFLSKHHSHCGDTSLLLAQTYPMDHLPDYPHRDPYLASGDYKFGNMVKLDWHPRFHEKDPYFRIVGSSIHGTFCLHQFERFNSNNYVLWNPATEEFKIIPHSTLDYQPPVYSRVNACGFGYDTVRGDLKVIRLLVFSIGEPEIVPRWPFVEVYSLKSNSWRTLDTLSEDLLFCADDEIYVNGMCHWLNTEYRYGEGGMLVSFNISSEVFLQTPLPLDPDECYEKFLLELNGSIAVILKRADKTFHMSILGELGVKESWTTLFIVGPFPDIGLLFGVSQKGDIFFRKEAGELAMFNLSNQMLEEIVTEEQLDHHRKIMYSKSLLPIERKEY